MRILSVSSTKARYSAMEFGPSRVLVWMMHAIAGGSTNWSSVKKVAGVTNRVASITKTISASSPKLSNNTKIVLRSTGSTTTTKQKSAGESGISFRTTNSYQLTIHSTRRDWRRLVWSITRVMDMNWYDIAGSSVLCRSGANAAAPRN